MMVKIEDKIHEIIEYIISKPAEEITLDEYTVLKNELLDIRAKEDKKENGKRMAELMANALSATNSY